MELRDRLLGYYFSERELVINKQVHEFFDMVAELAFEGEPPDVKQHVSRQILSRFNSPQELSKRLSFIKDKGFRALENPYSFIDAEHFIGLGDSCLFMGGMFPERLVRERDFRGPGYFTAFGKQCYIVALDCSGINMRRELVGRFADNIGDYIKRLNVVAETRLP